MQLLVDYPDLLPDALHLSRTQFEQEAPMAMAAKLYEMGRLSSGQAAELAGMGRVEFILSLPRYGVAYLNYPADELEQDVSHALDLGASH